jgi:hypothetical protein
MRVNISATVSLDAIVFSVNLLGFYFSLEARQSRPVVYQLDLTTPGSCPSEARFRKQIRQIPNFLIKPRGRPHIGQRL